MLKSFETNQRPQDPLALRGKAHTLLRQHLEAIARTLESRTVLQRWTTTSTDPVTTELAQIACRLLDMGHRVVTLDGGDDGIDFEVDGVPMTSREARALVRGIRTLYEIEISGRLDPAG